MGGPTPEAQGAGVPDGEASPPGGPPDPGGPEAHSGGPWPEAHGEGGPEGDASPREGTLAGPGRRPNEGEGVSAGGASPSGGSPQYHHHLNLSSALADAADLVCAEFGAAAHPSGRDATPAQQQAGVPSGGSEQPAPSAGEAIVAEEQRAVCAGSAGHHLNLSGALADSADHVGAGLGAAAFPSGRDATPAEQQADVPSGGAEKRAPIADEAIVAEEQRAVSAGSAGAEVALAGSLNVGSSGPLAAARSPERGTVLGALRRDESLINEAPAIGSKELDAMRDSTVEGGPSPQQRPPWCPCPGLGDKPVRVKVVAGDFAGRQGVLIGGWERGRVLLLSGGRKERKRERCLDWHCLELDAAG